MAFAETDSVADTTLELSDSEAKSLVSDLINEAIVSLPSFSVGSVETSLVFGVRGGVSLGAPV